MFLAQSAMGPTPAWAMIRGVGCASSETRFKLKALCTLSDSWVESRALSRVESRALSRIESRALSRVESKALSS